MDIFGKIKNTLLKINFKNVFKSPSITSGRGKRFFVIILLFFVLSGIILPKIASASVVSWLLGGVGGDIANGFLNAASFIIGAVPLFITAFLADLSYALLQLALGFTQTIKYTSNDAVNIGWPIMRDLANMFVVLGFVIIGLATILRFRNYEAQKLLLPLIVAALLINFSIVICGVFIDASNIVTNYFLTKGHSGFSLFTQNLNRAQALLTSGSIKDDNFIAYAAKIYSLVFFNIMSIIIFVLYTALLLFRVVALFILIILSPIAFVSYVFPFTKKFWSMWWNNFFAWCIIGMPAGLFLFIGSEMIRKTTATPLSFDGSLMSYEDIINKVAAYAGLTLIPSLFLIMGFLFSLKTSAMGADIITSRAKPLAMKYGKGMLGASMSASKKLGQKLQSIPYAGKILGAPSKAVEGAIGGFKYAKRKATETAEDYGIVPPGTSAAGAEVKTGENRKRLEALYKSDPTKLAKVAMQNAVTQPEKVDKRVAAEILAENNDLGKIEVKGGTPAQTEALRGAIVRHAINNGAQMKTFSKADYRLAKFDEKKVEETMSTLNPITGTNYTKAQAEDKLVDDAAKKMDVSAIRTVDTDALDITFLRNTTAKKIEKAGEDLHADKKTKLKSYIATARSNYLLATAGSPERMHWGSIHNALVKLK